MEKNTNKWIEEFIYIASNYDKLDKEYFNFVIENNELKNIGLRNEKELIIPEGVKKIGFKVFSFLTDTEIIILPKELEEIKSYAFYMCLGLKKVILPENLLKIGEYAFAGNYILQEIKVPSNIVSIEEGTFMNCHEMRKVFLCNNIKEIKKFAFAHCELLEEIIYNGSETEWNLIKKDDSWNLNSHNIKIIYKVN